MKSDLSAGYNIYIDHDYDNAYDLMMIKLVGSDTLYAATSFYNPGVEDQLNTSSSVSVRPWIWKFGVSTSGFDRTMY